MHSFSSKQQLEQIARIIRGYSRTPFMSDSIPGELMEDILADVTSGKSLKTYDFIDVYNKNDNIGWQVKSTKDSTPVTWKRAKIAHADELIKEAQNSNEGLQKLGNAIINYCNSHVKESFIKYDLEAIYYSRLVISESRKISEVKEVMYFEKILCSKDNPMIFDPNDYTWEWSQPKKTIKKEQLPALHGKNIHTQTKWFAWHGLGENQLHFTGEKTWWPSPNDPHYIKFELVDSTEKINTEEYMDLLKSLAK
jgi:hypothetical protein